MTKWTGCKHHGSIQVTPDGECTMRTNLGAAAGLTDISQLPEDWLEDCKLLHLEGYILYKPQLLQQVLEAAKRLNILVSFISIAEKSDVILSATAIT